MQLKVLFKQATFKVPKQLYSYKIHYLFITSFTPFAFLYKRSFLPLPLLSANFKNTFNNNLNLNDFIRFKNNPSNNNIKPLNHLRERDS